MAIKADYAEWRKTARDTSTGFGHIARPDRSAMDVSEEERRATYDARWEIGGLFFLGRSTTYC